MKRFYHDSETRTFTDQGIAKENESNFKIIITHLLKLKYALGSYYDHDNHTRDIANLCNSIYKQIRSDRKVVGGIYTMDQYEKLLLKSSSKNKIGIGKIILSNQISSEFKKDYQFEGKILVSDIDEMIKLISVLITYPSTNDTIDTLNRLFSIK